MKSSCSFSFGKTASSSHEKLKTKNKMHSEFANKILKNTSIVSFGREKYVAMHLQ
jgi:hypothetical protein